MREEKIVVGKGTEFPLNGLLTLPEGKEDNIPGVVLVQGSGSSNMDEKIYKNTPFKDLAEGLSARGIAVIRYDKRTFAYKKETKKTIADVDVRIETINDAIAASNLLRADSRIGKVFMAGHSMGGMLAPRIDAEGGDFDGLIIMAGTPRTLWTLLGEQLTAMIQSSKWPVKNIIRSQYNKIARNMEGIEDLSREEAKAKKVVGSTRAYYFKEMDDHATRTYLEQCTKPMFIFQGEKDFQVYAEKDFELYKEILKDHEDVTFKLYPNLNHLFMPSITGDVKEYKTPAKVDENVVNDMAKWILAH